MRINLSHNRRPTSLSMLLKHLPAKAIRNLRHGCCKVLPMPILTYGALLRHFLCSVSIKNWQAIVVQILSFIYLTASLSAENPLVDGAPPGITVDLRDPDCSYGTLRTSAGGVITAP